jgi:hypothetical protein
MTDKTHFADDETLAYIRRLEQKVAELQEQLTTLKKECAQSFALAAVTIDDWGNYAGEYFKNKWNLRADVERFEKYAAAMKEGS